MARTLIDLEEPYQMVAHQYVVVELRNGARTYIAIVVERDYVNANGSCPDYLEVKFEKAPVQRKSSVVETESIIEEDTSDMREVMDEDNEDDEPLELDSEDEE